jgi:hypothetical protein
MPALDCVDFVFERAASGEGGEGLLILGIDEGRGGSGGDGVGSFVGIDVWEKLV